MDELAVRLAALTDPPLRLPRPLPPPASGDGEVDARFAALDAPVHTHGLRIEEARAALAGAPPSAAVARAAARWLHAIAAERAPPPPPRELVRTRDEQLQLGTLLQPVRVAWGARQLLAGHLAALLVHHDDRAHATLLSRLDAHPHLAALLSPHLLASLPPEGPARATALARLGAHLVPGDHRAPIAAVALVLRDGFAAGPALRAFLDACPDDLERARVAVAVSGRRAEVDLDAEPGWIDVLFPKVVHLGVAIELLYRLHDVRTAEPLLRALAYRDDEPCWADLLEGLRRVDDASAAPRLEAIAATLPEEPRGKRLSRSPRSLRALAKRLRRAQNDRASFTLEPGVGTEGGPILLVPQHAAHAWQGVPRDQPGPTDRPSDYDRACAASDAGQGALAVGGAKALVLAEQVVEHAPLAGGGWLLVALGTSLQLEEALRAPRKWKKTRITLEVGESGAVLLDAAHTPTSASREEGALASLALRPGRYDVLAVSDPSLRAWRLAPSTRRA
jgi:hypothetical protein